MIVDETNINEAYGILGILNRSYIKYDNEMFLFCDGEQLSYEDLVFKGERFASFLYELGIRKGDRVGIISPNSCNWYVFMYGVLRIGAIVTPFDPLLGEGELLSLVKKVGIRNVICVPKYRGVNYINLFGELHKKDYDLKNVVVDGEIEEDLFFVKYEDESISKKKLPNFELKKEDSNVFLCTTGSTGTAKIVDLDCNFFDNCIEKYGSYLEFDVSNVKFYSAMPLYHAAGLGYGLCCMCKGGKMFYEKRFLPTKTLELLEKEEITTVLSTPTVMKIMKSHENFDDYKLENLKKIIFTGEALNDELVSEFIEKFGVRILNILGSSENFIYLIWDSLVDSEFSVCSFSSVSDLEVQVFEKGKKCKKGEKGIIKIKNQIMKGYYNAPDLTSEVISEEGEDRWFDSGDRGVLLDNNRFSYLGRKKRVMKRGGNLVSFEEVEQTIGLNEQVALAVVTNDKDEIIGEKLVAYVQPVQNAKTSKNALFSFLRKEIAAYKVPDEIYFVDEIPKSNGKASVRKLKQMVADGVKNIY